MPSLKPIIMNADYLNILNKAKQEKKQIRRTLTKLRKMRKGDVDKIIHKLHYQAFEHIDCLECANCCKTTGPLFSQKDIERIANHLNISANAFIEKTLRKDEDGDYVLQTVPCTFLSPDNKCSIYHIRPKACREYPHTDRVNQLGILKLTEKNAVICPAVATIIENI